MNPQGKDYKQDQLTNVKVEEVQCYMLNLQNNHKLDKSPMNNQTIHLQIAVLEVQYYKIRHINPFLADVDMKFYRSLPPVQEILEEMTRLEILAM